MNQQEPLEMPSREAFVARSIQTEQVWERPDLFGLEWEYNPTWRTEIGPWTCACGFRCRDAGRMWDHAQTCQGGPPVQATLFDEVA